MILWGTGERVVEFDVIERAYCAKCEQERDFFMRLKYEFGHFYHLFGWVISREYQLVCPHCGHGWVLDPVSARAQLGRDPVPFYQRSGWLVMLALFVLIAVAALAYRGGGR